MTHSILGNDDWTQIVSKLGGADALSRSAKEAGAFVRARRVRSAEDLLRLCLAYGPGGMSLRTLSGWAAAHDFAHLSDVAIMERLQNCGDWLAGLIGTLLAQGTPDAVGSRPIRLVDGTVVSKAGAGRQGGTGLWRLHAAFGIGADAFDHLALTDQTGGERFDRAPVVEGEIRIGDRAYMQPDRIARVLDDGGDVVVRSGWRNANWRDADGAPLDIIAMLEAVGGQDVLDLSIGIGRRAGPPLEGLRLVAIRKSPERAEASRKKARKAARSGQHRLKRETLVAAEWVLLVTSLDRLAFDAEGIGALYRLRWRIEIAFKRLKSLAGYRSPPGKDERLARTFLLGHLLFALIADIAHAELCDSSP